MAVPLARYGMAAAGPSPGALPPGGYAPQLPKRVQQDMAIQQLCEVYQQELAELNACHSLLVVDQERLASMLAPYVDSRGELSMTQPDPDVLLFKQGLDLRLSQFADDCTRIKKTERKLQQAIDAATTDYEQTVTGISMATDSRIFKRLREQERLIELQQREIDQARFEKEMLQEETRRLREMTSRGAMVEARRMARDEAGALESLPRLHQTYEASARAPPMEGTRHHVLFNR